jgi:hypothetical protein
MIQHLQTTIKMFHDITVLLLSRLTKTHHNKSFISKTIQNLKSLILNKTSVTAYTFFTKYYWDGHMKEGEMGGACRRMRI